MQTTFFVDLITVLHTYERWKVGKWKCRNIKMKTQKRDINRAIKIVAIRLTSNSDSIEKSSESVINNCCLLKMLFWFVEAKSLERTQHHKKHKLFQISIATLFACGTQEFLLKNIVFWPLKIVWTHKQPSKINCGLKTEKYYVRVCAFTIATRRRWKQNPILNFSAAIRDCNVFSHYKNRAEQTVQIFFRQHDLMSL